MNTPTQNLRSSGQICRDTGISYPDLVRRIQVNRIEPTVRINGLAYYDDATVSRIADSPTETKGSGSIHTRGTATRVSRAGRTEIRG